MDPKDPAPKKDNRGGKRPNSGPKPSFVWLEVGEDLLKNLKEYCDLRDHLGLERIKPIEFLETICKDRLDSPWFIKSLERLRLAKKMKDAGISEDMQDEDPF